MINLKYLQFPETNISNCGICWKSNSELVAAAKLEVVVGFVVVASNDVKPVVMWMPQWYQLMEEEILHLVETKKYCFLVEDFDMELHIDEISSEELITIIYSECPFGDNLSVEKQPDVEITYMILSLI